jgi:hypothetical protein
VKAYGKALRAEGSVFRVETTVNQAGEFKVYRRKEGDKTGPKAWRDGGSLTCREGRMSRSNATSGTWVLWLAWRRASDWES